MDTVAGPFEQQEVERWALGVVGIQGEQRGAAVDEAGGETPAAQFVVVAEVLRDARFAVGLDAIDEG